MSHESVVIVSDIHGNAPALKSVIEREGRDPVYVILGDIVGLAPFPEWTLSLIQSLPTTHTLRGNHDHAVFVEGEGHVSNEALTTFEHSWNTAHTSEESRAFVRGLPSYDTASVGDLDIVMAHAQLTPELSCGHTSGNSGLDKSAVPRVASRLAPTFEYGMVGHTHEQWVVDCSTFGHDITLLNPGSLGYENEYLTLDTETGHISRKEVSYSIDIAAHLDGWVLPEECPPASIWW